VDVFVSIGSKLNPKQEAFVVAVENRLRTEGLTPHTLNRNSWSTAAPLAAVNELMDRCDGAVVLGLERLYFPSGGVERRGSTAKADLKDPVILATSWNHIEATVAHTRGLPLFVIVDENLRADGLLEPGNDWNVAPLKIDASALNSDMFRELLRDWKQKVVKRKADLAAAAAAQAASAAAATTPVAPLEPSKLSTIQLLGALRLAEVWALLGAIVVMLAAAFGAGVKLAPLLDKDKPAGPAATASASPAAARPNPR